MCVYVCIILLHKLLMFSQDPKMYVQTVLDVHKKYNALVMSAFNNDAGFVAALDKVCIFIYCFLIAVLPTNSEQFPHKSALHYRLVVDL